MSLEFVVATDKADSGREVVSMYCRSVEVIFHAVGAKGHCVNRHDNPITHFAISEIGHPVAHIFELSKLDYGDWNAIRSLLSSENVLKMMFDGRHAADCLKHTHSVMLKRVCDVQLCVISSGAYRDAHPGRTRRGVVRLPIFAPPQEEECPLRGYEVLTSSFSQLHAAVEGMKGNMDFEESVGASMNYISMIAASEKRFEPHPFLPLGLLSDIPRNGARNIKCQLCNTMLAASAFPVEVAKICKVCLEMTLPCASYKVYGKCVTTGCPYKHEIIDCSRGAACVDHVTLFICPFKHPNEDTFASLSSGEVACDEMGCDGTPVKGAPTSEVDQNISQEEVTNPSDTPQRVCDTEDVSMHFPLPPLYPSLGFRPPCRYFFSGMCSKGESCNFSHVPVPVYVPIPVPMKCKQKQVSKFTPCVNFAKGKCKQGTKCQSLHLPREFTATNPVAWGSLPMA